MSIPTQNEPAKPEDYLPPPPVQQVTAPRTANQMPVSYVRQQKGHSILLHLFIIGPFTLWIPAIYYSVSPNHYWHA